PLRISWLHSAFELFRRSPTDNLIWKIDSCPLIQIELVHHPYDSVNAHLQTKAIEISVAGVNDRCFQIGSPMVSHAARKLVADRNAAATNEIRMIQSNGALL